MGVGAADDVGPRLRVKLLRDPNELEAILGRQDGLRDGDGVQGQRQRGRPRADCGGRPSRSSLIFGPCRYTAKPGAQPDPPAAGDDYREARSTVNGNNSSGWCRRTPRACRRLGRGHVLELARPLSPHDLGPEIVEALLPRDRGLPAGLAGDAVDRGARVDRPAADCVRPGRDSRGPCGRSAESVVRARRRTCREWPVPTW